MASRFSPRGGPERCVAPPAPKGLPPKNASKMSPIPAVPPKPPKGAAGRRPGPVGAEHVVLAAALGVLQGLVGAVDQLELLFVGLGGGAGVAVRVQLPGQVPVGTLDLVLVGATGHAEDGVIVLSSHCQLVLLCLPEAGEGPWSPSLSALLSFLETMATAAKAWS
jgi:hypothetical protein